MPERPFRTAAAHYGDRPPYSAALRPALRARLGWDGSGRLLDAGSGPGTLALELTPDFADVVALDPEPAMLAAGRARAGDARIRWVEGRAEDIPRLGLRGFQAVTLGQSLHRMDRESVLEIVHGILVPGGAVALVHHTERGFGLPDPGAPESPRPRPPAGIPEIPYDLVWDAIRRYLGFVPEAPPPDAERHDAVLARSSFRDRERLVLPGRTDVIRTPEHVVGMYLSTSFAAPERFGDRLDAFRAELVDALRRATPTGLLWEWPGDTEVLLGLR